MSGAERLCVVCSALVERRAVVCRSAECLRTWQAWRVDASARMARDGAGPHPQAPRARERCKRCNNWTWGAERRDGLCAGCNATIEGLDAAQARALQRPTRAQAARCTGCGRRALKAEGRGGLCTSCHDEAARDTLRACVVCAQDIGGTHRSQRYCGRECILAARRAARDGAPVARPAAPKAPPVKRPAGLPCATCAHARTSKASETGYVCTIEAVGRCRPHGLALLHRHWEAEA